jgi:hypothetical protein
MDSEEHHTSSGPKGLNKNHRDLDPISRYSRAPDTAGYRGGGNVSVRLNGESSGPDAHFMISNLSPASAAPHDLEERNDLEDPQRRHELLGGARKSSP